MIFDAHTHVWPDKIARRALAGRVEGLHASGDGTVSGLLASMDRCGIDRALALGIADQAKYVDRTNEFISGIRSDRLTPFGTVHVDLPAEENLASLRRHGVRGVKLHPLFQGFALNDKRLWEMFEAFGPEIAVISHVGEGGDAEANARSSPRMIADIARTFPDLRLMACHFGGYRLFEQAREELAGADVVLETSWPPTLAGLAPSEVRRLITDHGAERIVFGSDWPMTDPAAEIAAVRALGLRDEDTELVLGGTLTRLTQGC